MNVFSLMAKLSLDKSEYTNGLNQAEGESESFGGKLGKGLSSVAKVGAQALAGATAAVTAFGAAAIKTGMDFDSSMSQVEATMGFNAREMIEYNGQTMTSIDALREFAQEMGATTAFSASQSADALNYMALAGYNAEQSMEMLPTVLNLAAAGGIDLANASDMVTDASSALGLTFDETKDLVDQMAAASQRSNTSVAQLGEAILTVGGTAKNLSGGTTELATALGILADNGTKGAEGGTALRNIMLSLSAPTDKASEALDALGVSAFDIEGNMRPLQDVFQDLNGAMADMTQGKKTQVLNEIFNKVDLKSVNALMDTNIERWEDLSDAINDSAGDAETMAEVQLDNLAGDITLLKSAFEGFQIAVSEGGTDTLRGFVQFASSSLSTLTEAYKKDGVKGAMDAMSGILTQGLSMITDLIPKLIESGASLLDSLINGIVSNIPQLTTSVVSIVETFIKGLTSNLPKVIEGGIQIVVSLAEGLADSLPDLIPQAVDMIITIVEGLIDNIDKVVDAAVKIIMALAEGLIKSLPKLVQKVPEIIVKLVKAFAENAPKLFEASLKMISALWQGLKDNLPVLLSKIPEMMVSIVNAYKEYASAMLEIGGEWIESLWEGIGNKVEWLKEKIAGFVGNVKDWLKKFFTGGESEGTSEGGGGGRGTERSTKSTRTDLITDMSTAFDSASMSTSLSTSNAAVVKAINKLNDNIINNMVDALSEGLTFEWDDRTVGRMVKSYA